MPYYSQEIINRAKEMDLLTYLQRYEPNEIVRISNNTYTTRTHDSLKISNGMWMWWSRGVGGKSAIDYLMRVKGLTFIEAVSVIATDSYIMNKPYTSPKKAERKLILPAKADNNDELFRYLKSRGINENVIAYFIGRGLIYQSKPMNNIVFVGLDEKGKPRYAGLRGTDKCRYLGDAAGSNKAYSFRLANEDNTSIHFFEGAIDLLSYATLLYEQGSDFICQNLVSLSGIYNPSKDIKNTHLPVSLVKVLEIYPQIKTVYLHLDNDFAGRRASNVIKTLLDNKYEIKEHFVPVGKDVNDYLCYTKNIPFKKPKSYERSDDR